MTTTSETKKELEAELLKSIFIDTFTYTVTIITEICIRWIPASLKVGIPYAVFQIGHIVITDTEPSTTVNIMFALTAVVVWIWECIWSIPCVDSAYAETIAIRKCIRRHDAESDNDEVITPHQKTTSTEITLK